MAGCAKVTHESERRAALSASSLRSSVSARNDNSITAAATPSAWGSTRLVGCSASAARNESELTLDGDGVESSGSSQSTACEANARAWRERGAKWADQCETSECTSSAVMEEDEEGEEAACDV